MVAICNSYLCKLCIVFDLYYLCPRKNNYAYEVPYRNTGFREDYRGRICIESSGRVERGSFTLTLSQNRA